MRVSLEDFDFLSKHTRGSFQEVAVFIPTCAQRNEGTLSVAQKCGQSTGIPRAIMFQLTNYGWPVPSEECVADLGLEPSLCHVPPRR